MTAPSTNTGVILTDAAAAKAKALLEQEGREDLALRIAVQPGGCAGLRYQLFFDDRRWCAPCRGQDECALPRRCPD